MSFSIRLNGDEERFFKSYAKIHGCTLGEAMKEELLEKIQYEYNVALAEQTHKEFLKTKKVLTLEEQNNEIEI